MNVTTRKLALLEKSMLEMEEVSKFNNYVSDPIDENLKNNVQELMKRIRQV